MPRLTKPTLQKIDIDAVARVNLYTDLINELYTPSYKYHRNQLNELAWKNIKIQQLDFMKRDYVTVYKSVHYYVDSEVIENQRNTLGMNYSVHYISVHNTLLSEFDRVLKDLSCIDKEKHKVSVYLSTLMSEVKEARYLASILPNGVQNVLFKLLPNLTPDKSIDYRHLLDPLIDEIMNQRVLTNILLNE